MPTKIFVGRLVDGISNDEIRALFRKFGAVTECDVIANYGFVVSNHSDRIFAISALQFLPYTMQHYA